jgi:hypothetical protein
LEILDQFTNGTILAVSTTFLAGATIFTTQNDDGNVLEQIFCFAIRAALLDEIEGIERSPQAQLESVVGRLSPDTPVPLIRAFRTLSAAAFSDWYRIIRKKAEDLGVDPAEFANGLRVAKQITSAVARRQ